MISVRKVDSPCEFWVSVCRKAVGWALWLARALSHAPQPAEGNMLIASPDAASVTATCGTDANAPPLTSAPSMTAQITKDIRPIVGLHVGPMLDLPVRYLTLFAKQIFALLEKKSLHFQQCFYHTRCCLLIGAEWRAHICACVCVWKQRSVKEICIKIHIVFIERN